MTDKTSKKNANPTASASPLFSMNQFKPALEWMERWSRAAPQVGAGVPGFSQWIAPTLDPKELEKRIGDLRTVHFWLEQNARMVAATIQALEVQRMTLNTLQSMNVPLQTPAAGASQAPSREFSAPPQNEDAPRAKRGGGAKGKGQPAADVAAALSRSGMDAVNWWNAMTEQFGQLASQAMKDVAASGQAMSTAAAAASPAPAAKASAAKAPTARRRSVGKNTGAAGGRR
jgi:hypothetical protein